MAGAGPRITQPPRAIIRWRPANTADLGESVPVVDPNMPDHTPRQADRGAAACQSRRLGAPHPSSAGKYWKLLDGRYMNRGGRCKLWTGVAHRASRSRISSRIDKKVIISRPVSAIGLLFVDPYSTDCPRSSGSL